MDQFWSFLGYKKNNDKTHSKNKSTTSTHKGKMSNEKDEKKNGASAAGARWVIDVTSNEQFEELLKKNERVVIKFGTPTCKPCNKIAPHLETLAQQYSSKLVAANVHPEHLEALAEKYDVEFWPMFVFFKNNQQVKELSYQGADPTILAHKIKTLLS